jgi:hypothetical protein
MGIFTALAGLFRRTESTPPRMAPSFSPSGLDQPDDDMSIIVEITVSFEGGLEDDVTERKPAKRADHKAWLFGREDIKRVDDDLWGVTFAIEYIDAKGDSSHRRVTLHDIYVSDAGVIYLSCLCHERKAKRTFRFDRVQSIIDMDGVIHEPQVFFTNELCVSLPMADAAHNTPKRERDTPKAKPPRPAEKPGMAQRRAARDGLRVLVALARSDGLLHPEEVEVNLQYIGHKAERAGLPMTEEDCVALTGYLRRQYPSSEVLEECLGRLEQESVEEQQLLVRSAIALMDADGVQDGAEFDLLMEIQQRLETAANTAQ